MKANDSLREDRTVMNSRNIVLMKMNLRDPLKRWRAVVEEGTM